VFPCEYVLGRDFPHPTVYMSVYVGAARAVSAAHVQRLKPSGAPAFGVGPTRIVPAAPALDVGLVDA